MHWFVTICWPIPPPKVVPDALTAEPSLHFWYSSDHTTLDPVEYKLYAPKKSQYLVKLLKVYGNG